MSESQNHIANELQAMRNKTGMLLIAIAAACDETYAQNGAPVSSAASAPAAPAASMSANPTPSPPPPPPSASVLASVGALPSTQDDLIEKLQSFDRVLAHSPDNHEAREGRLLTLARLGAVDIAIAEAARYPLVREEVVMRLYEEQATLALRWSQNTYHAIPSDEYPGYDRAISLAQANLQRYPNSLQSRYDLVRMLNNRRRRSEAIAIYEALLVGDRGNQQRIPPEVHESAASAYIAEKKPELAEQAYRDALAGKPDSFGAKLGLFYALVDQTRYAQARQYIDDLAAQPLLPDQKFSAAKAAALERAYESRPDRAQKLLEALQQEAPSSDQLHIALGKVYLWRGWPRRARDQFSLVTVSEPDNFEADTALAETDTALGNFAAADRRLAQLKQDTPEEEDVKTQLRAQEVRNYNELTVSLAGTRSSENLGSGRGVIVESKLLAKPLSPQLRPFIHQYFERGTSSEVSADYRRLGAGLQYTLPELGVIDAEVQQEFFKQPRTSISLSGKFTLSDQWLLSSRIDSSSIEVPLVARYYGISGWLAGVGLAYRHSERWTVSADVSQLNMSDQNTRRAALLTATATVMQDAFYKGSVELELYRATNTVGNAVYFNPGNSRTLMLSYVSDWANFHRYDQSFGQRVTVSIGRQAEDGFATGTIGGISYEQRVSVSDVLSVDYGGGFVRRLYGGTVSAGPELHVNLNWKFL